MVPGCCDGVPLPLFGPCFGTPFVGWSRLLEVLKACPSVPFGPWQWGGAWRSLPPSKLFRRYGFSRDEPNSGFDAKAAYFLLHTLPAAAIITLSHWHIPTEITRTSSFMFACTVSMFPF